MTKFSKQTCVKYRRPRLHWVGFSGYLLAIGGLTVGEFGCGTSTDEVKTHREVDDEERASPSNSVADGDSPAQVLTSEAETTSDVTSSQEVGAARACYVDSHIIALGTTLPCPDMCNTCECTESGIEWRTHDECPNIAIPEGCVDGHANGETWACDDGCNTCTCEAGVVSRTIQVCDRTHVCEGEFLIHQQAELDVLNGCNEITRNLYIFADLDLEPLAQLQRVGGILSLSNYDGGMAPAFASLSGLRSLQHAGGLWLANVLVSDLSELVQLSEVGDSEIGGLQISDGSPNLKDLSGLGRLTSLDRLSLSDLLNFETLEGAQLPATTSVGLYNLPKLRSLEGLREVEDLQFLDVIGCSGLEDLNTGAMSVRLGALNVEDNASLVSFSGLAHLAALESLRVRGNSQMQALTLPALQSVAYELWVERNDELRELELPALESADRFLVIHNSSLPNQMAEALAANLDASGTVKIALNLDDPLGVRDPCPWLEDRECDVRLGICVSDDPDCFSLFHLRAP